MSDSVAVVWDDALLAYDFGPGHPFSPLRTRLAMSLVRELGLLEAEHVQVLAPSPATRAELEAVHEASYVDAVIRCSGADHCSDPPRGLGTDDNPVFAGMHDAAALVAGGTLQAARAVWEGTHQHAVHLAGGLHHAMPDGAAGFCIYNDLAVAIQWLLDNGAQRVAYIDIDVHHGDGVERAFWNDPRVMTISLHENGNSQFPGTGWALDIGGDDAACTKVNCALPAGTTDDAWLRAFDAIVPPLIRDFAPEVIVTQQGCDGHAEDPLGHLRLSVDGMRQAYQRLHDLTHEVSQGRWIATGGGGYSVIQVVPRAWSHLVAEVVGARIDVTSAPPDRWREDVQAITGRSGPDLMGDGEVALEFTAWVDSHDPNDPVDAAISATRHSVFPAHGLDPLSA